MDTQSLEQLSLDELMELSEKNTSDFRLNRSRLYELAFKKYEEKGQTDRLDDMAREVRIFQLSTRGSPKIRFRPLATYTTETGEEFGFPDMERDFHDEDIEYYKKRANTTDNPILKSRYCDFIWEKKKDVHFARNAISAYLNCCQIYIANEWDLELVDALSRAIQLASAINDQDLIETSLQKHLEVLERLSKGKRVTQIGNVVKSVLDHSGKVTGQIDYEYLLSIMELSIKECDENIPDGFHFQRDLLIQIARIYKIQGNDEDFVKTRVRIAESFVQEAEWKRVNYSSGNLVAATFYGHALQEYINIGSFPDRFNELKVKIKEINEAAALAGEYKAISTEIEIPAEPIKAHLKIYEEKKPKEVFQIMATDPYLIPSYTSSVETATQILDEAVMLRLIPMSITKGNIKVKQLDEESEKLEYQAISTFKNSYRIILKTLIAGIFLLLEKDDNSYIDDLIQFLSESVIISSERIEIIKAGIEAYGNDNYIAAFHILIFQIEGILRDLLGKLGLPTFSYRASEMRERVLPDILKTLSGVQGFNIDLLKLMEIMLCRIEGDNYRNDAAHGLLSVESCTKGNCQLLLLILVKLAAYSIVKVDSRESNHN